MADMHVLTGDGKTWVIVMHFAVPDTSNAVGVNHRTALVNSGLGGTTVLSDGDGTLGTIDATEKTAVENGSVVERPVAFLVESGGTEVPELRATLRNLYAREETRVVAELKQQLRYFGHTESQA